MSQPYPIRMAFLLPAAALAVVPFDLRAGEAEPGTDEAGTGTRVFWRVDKPAGGSMYLLGSLHFGDASLFPLPDVILSAYDASATLVFETDLREASGVDYSTHMLERARVADGQTLADTIGADAFAMFEQTARTFALNPLSFETYRAWYCANSLMTVALRRAGVDPARGIDRVLFSQAERDGKRIVAFETPEFQLELFAGLSDAQASELLVQAIGEISQVGLFVTSMLQAYRNGDLGALQGMINDGFDGLPDLRKRFFTDRNAAWVARLRELAREPGDMLVVVGSGHLLGKGSLVDLLGTEGFTVTRL